MIPGRRKMIPWWGYVAINVVVIAFLTLIFLAGEYYSRSYHARSAGIFPVLATCYAAFLFVSIFDAAYDRLDARRKRRARQRHLSDDSQPTSKRTD